MSRRSKRQRFYARMRRERSTPKWLWTVDMTDLIPLGAIEALVTRMQSLSTVPAPTIPEPDPLF